VRNSQPSDKTGSTLTFEAWCAILLSLITKVLVVIGSFAAMVTFGMSKSGTLTDLAISIWPVLLAGAFAIAADFAVGLRRGPLALGLAATGVGILLFLLIGGWGWLEDIGWL
jgi:hypothetical protein